MFRDSSKEMASNKRVGTHPTTSSFSSSAAGRPLVHQRSLRNFHAGVGTANRFAAGSHSRAFGAPPSLAGARLQMIEGKANPLNVNTRSQQPSNVKFGNTNHFQQNIARPMGSLSAASAFHNSSSQTMHSSRNMFSPRQSVNAFQNRVSLWDVFESSPKRNDSAGMPSFFPPQNQIKSAGMPFFPPQNKMKSAGMPFIPPGNEMNYVEQPMCVSQGKVNSAGQTSACSHNKIYSVVPLDASHPEYKNCISVLGSGCPQTPSQVFKVVNPYMVNAFRSRKTYLQEQNPGINYREEQLFHGTSPNNIQGILEDNIDWRLHGTNVGQKFGRGSYFSNRAQISRSYGEVLFICKVLVGLTAVGTHTTVRPPKDRNNRPIDTTVDNVANPSIFVKYSSAEYYPEYYVIF